MENGVAILWKSYLQLFAKSTCKKHTGVLDISYKIMEEYKACSKHNVYKLSVIAKQHLKELSNIKGNGNYNNIGIVFAEYSTNVDKVNLYYLGSKDEFKVVTKKIEKNQTAIYCDGIKTKECFDTAYKYLSENPEINYVYKNTFNEMSFEGIGGNLFAYQINRNGIKQVINSKIKEKENMRFLKIVNDKAAVVLNAVVAQQLYGKLVGSNKLIITNVNDNGESSFLVDKDHMQAVNMDLALENKAHVNRIYLNPDQGFKIQKKNSGTWEDQLWEDTDGNVYAKSFHVINTHSTLDDDGLVIDNGYIKINNQTGDTVFNVDTNGDVNALGRFQVFRHDGSNKVILADLYKDLNKGGKLAINEWYGKKDAFIGSSPNDKYIGGFLKLYNEGEDKPRIEMGIFHDDDAGTINLSDVSNTPKVHISAKDGINNHGVISLFGEDKNVKLMLKARSDTDNMSNTLSGDRKTGGYIEFNSYDNSTKYFITANNENNFGLYDTLRSAFEINHNNDSVSVGHQANEILTLAKGVITLGFSTVEHEYDLTKPYLRMTETGLILGMGDNKLSITSSGVKLDGTRIDLN